MTNYKIMVVDDEPANLRLLERLFRRDYTIVAASSGAEALSLLEQHDVALLITDQRMPGMTGIELLKRTAELRPHTVRIILTGYTDTHALVEAINCGQVYRYLTKPWNNEELRQTVARALQHYEANRSRHDLELANERLWARLQEMTRGFVRAIADALDAKDEYVHGQARRTCGYALATGRRMGLDRESLDELALAAFLHDIGKIGTPDAILMKPGALTTEERRIVQLHSERGARMLAGISDMQDVAAVVRHHHENFDGTGYPEGLSGAQIPLHARIIHVTDAYDAMTNPRPYREAIGHAEAIERIEQSAGADFDPEVVKAFKEIESLAQIRSFIKTNFAPSLIPVAHCEDAGEEDSGLDDLRREIETQPALAARVLCEANAVRGVEPTARLTVAAARLGAERVREIITRASESRANASDLLCREQARERALRCAIAARLLAERTGVINTEDAYTLGLLHDIGDMILRELFPEEMAAMEITSEDELLNREIISFGVDHAQVSEWALEACGVPRPLSAAVQMHHDMLRSNSPAALLLHVANVIAHSDDARKVSALDALGSDRLMMLGLDRAALAEIHARTASALEGYVVLS